MIVPYIVVNFNLIYGYFIDNEIINFNYSQIVPINQLDEYLY